eukprot:204973-Prorocentrum_minimum.AAC.1
MPPSGPISGTASLAWRTASGPPPRGSVRWPVGWGPSEGFPQSGRRRGGASGGWCSVSPPSWAACGGRCVTNVSLSATDALQMCHSPVQRGGGAQSHRQAGPCAEAGALRMCRSQLQLCYKCVTLRYSG